MAFALLLRPNFHELVTYKVYKNFHLINSGSFFLFVVVFVYFFSFNENRLKFYEGPTTTLMVFTDRVNALFSFIFSVLPC